MFEYRRRCGNCKSLWGTVENLFLIRSLGGCQITPSVSAGTVSPAPRPRADAWGYLDRQWIGFHHTLVGRTPMATGCKPAPQAQPNSSTSGDLNLLKHYLKRSREGRAADTACAKR